MTRKQIIALLESGLINKSELARRINPKLKKPVHYYNKKLRNHGTHKFTTQDANRILVLFRAIINK